MQFEHDKKFSSFTKPKILSQHVDTLVILAYSRDETAHTKYLLDFFNPLETDKEQAQEIESANSKDRYVEIEPFGSEYGIFRLYAQGMGQYKYKMQNDDVMIFLSKAKFGADAPQIKVEFRAHYLFAIGHKKAFKFIDTMLNKILGKKYETKVQRLDLATDMWGVRLDTFDLARFQNNYSNQLHRKGSKITGLSFGGGDFMFRIYDKTEQIRLSHSKHYVKRKWILNGYKEVDNMPVYRFEAQFRTAELKNIIPPNHTNQVEYVFNMLGSIWSKALNKIKYAPLTQQEAEKVLHGTITQSTKRDIFKKARDDAERFQFGTFLNHWDNNKGVLPMEYRDIKQPLEKTATRMLKGFISSAYKSGVNNPSNLSNLVQQLQDDLLLYEGLTIHQWANAKVLDSFVSRMRMIEKYNTNATYDYSLVERDAFNMLKNNFDNIDNVFMKFPQLKKTDSIEAYFELCDFLKSEQKATA